MSIISGKNINLRYVKTNDADFILSIRLDENLNKHISQVENSLEGQIQYIKKCQNQEDVHYFIIEDKKNSKLGAVRIYDVLDNSFCWGSWIIIPSAHKFTAIESALLIYEFAFYQLKFEQSHFDVRKNNVRVVDFHKRMGAKIVREDELNYYFIYKKEDYENIKPKYKRFLA